MTIARSLRDAPRDPAHHAGYWFMNVGEEVGKAQRKWEDSRRYGFLVAGGGPRWIAQAKKLRVGDRVFAYLTRHGYVGFAEVTATAVLFNEFKPEGHSMPLPLLPMVSKLETDRLAVPTKTDWCVGVKWIKALPRDEAVLLQRSRNGTLCRIKDGALVAELLLRFCHT